MDILFCLKILGQIAVRLCSDEHISSDVVYAFAYSSLLIAPDERYTRIHIDIIFLFLN